MFFQYEELHDRDRTMWGESPAEVALNLLAAGADIVGMNCGRGPDRAITIIREMRAVTDAPLIAYPNAGLPDHQGRRRPPTSSAPRPWPRTTRRCSTPGCNIVGACCGSGPEHIRLIAEVVARPAASGERARRPSSAPRAPVGARRPPPPHRSATRCLRFQGYKKGVDVPDRRGARPLRRGARARRAPHVPARGLSRRPRGDGAGGPTVIEAGGRARSHIPDIDRLWGRVDRGGRGDLHGGRAPSRRACARSSTRASSRWR